MANVARAFGEIRRTKSIWSKDLISLLDKELKEQYDYLKERGLATPKGVLKYWKNQASDAAEHGDVGEMKDIFQAHLKRLGFGNRMQNACEWGLRTYELRKQLLRQFMSLTLYGLLLILVMAGRFCLISTCLLHNFEPDLRDYVY